MAVDGVLKEARIVTIYGKRRVEGLIYDDFKGRFADGTLVTTSSIVKGPDDDGVVQTRNSTYRREFAASPAEQKG